VADASLDPHKICVSPHNFAEHLEVIRKRWNPISLQGLTEKLNAGGMPHRAVVLTFDDGYVDNLSNAAPLLSKFNVPATVFVTTGDIGRDRAFWSDDLAQLLFGPEVLPGRLRLSIGGEVCEWSFEGATYKNDEEAAKHRRWSMDQADLGPREVAHRALHKLLRPMPHSSRMEILRQLAEWTGSEPVPQPGHRVMRPTELLQLAKSGLVEIGAHTVTHPMLFSLSPEQQKWEIWESKAQLEKILQREITKFAYPYGGPADYDAGTVDLVREAGFTCACSTSTGLVGPRADRFQMPRFHVVDCDGNQFEKVLEGWFLS
jgi:peptidoglycan/xylan/chitin deacetylase (PgdA/CDA1 family)